MDALAQEVIDSYFREAPLRQNYALNAQGKQDFLFALTEYRSRQILSMRALVNSPFNNQLGTEIVSWKRREVVKNKNALFTEEADESQTFN